MNSTNYKGSAENPSQWPKTRIALKRQNRAMKAKADNSNYWQELISWRFWLHTAIVDILLAGIWFGINKLTTIVPIIRDIGFLILLVSGMFSVAWYLPKLSSRYPGRKTQLYVNGVHTKPSRLEHDNVLWEDGGRHGWSISVIGPLCPIDFVPLGAEKRDRIISNPSEDTVISDSDYHSRLFCPECGEKYTLGTQPKTIRDSRDEVRNRFEGKRRRDKES